MYGYNWGLPEPYVKKDVEEKEEHRTVKEVKKGMKMKKGPKYEPHPFGVTTIPSVDTMDGFE